MLRDLLDSMLKLLRSRLFILGTVFFILFSVLLGRVFYLQIVRGEDYLNNFKLQIQKSQEIKSTRGEIYDRNGVLLAYNELAYAVTIEDDGAYDHLTYREKNAALNDDILQLIRILDANGDETVTYFGIILDENGNFAFAAPEGTSRNRFIADVYGERYFDDLAPEQQYASPDQIMRYICSDDRYDIDLVHMDREEVLKIVNVRYAMTAINYTKYLVTTVAKDVSPETVAAVKENKSDLEGISIAQESLRRYVDPVYFSSLIGYTGVISQEEYETLSEQNSMYSRNDIVGKAGIEQVMDESLQGTKGHRTFYVDSVGKVLDVSEVVDPIAGNSLYLTIDHDLQIAVYKILEQKLAGIIYAHLVPEMDYDPHTAEKTNDIVIPIGDVYTAFFENLVFDISAFPEAEEGSVHARVYSAFQSRQEEVLNGIVAELTEPTRSYIQLSKEEQSYVDYILNNVLKGRGILNPSFIDTSDPTYLAWEHDGSISLREYLNYAISQNWIDSSKFEEELAEDEKYSDSTELIQYIISYLRTNLAEDRGFSRIIYSYMIRRGIISPSEVCLLLFEEGILENDSAAIAALSSGSADPYEFLREKIYNIEITPAQLGLEPSTASCVVTDPSSGDVLACVTYPGYDNNRMANTMDTAYYSKLLIDRSRPLYNHATQEKTAPGSTYKMMTAVAGLEAGMITGDSEIFCEGEFKYVDPNPKCWYYPGAHGWLDCTHAIAASCNCFFYEVGFRFGLNSLDELEDEEHAQYSTDRGIVRLSEYAKDFGFDKNSGLEITEADPEVSDTDSVRSAIGQGTNNYTTSQLARYAAVVASRGKVYDLTLLDKLKDSEGETVTDYKADVINEVSASPKTWDIVQEGMREMIQDSAAFQRIKDLGFSMAGKTGTAQQSDIHPDHVLFVGYAPYDDPQIAFAIRIANGYSSLYTSEVAQDVTRYYFELSDESDILTGQASEVGTVVSGD